VDDASDDAVVPGSCAAAGGREYCEKKRRREVS
jgi:hypothetical protein